MRKVTFYIDDIQYFRNVLRKNPYNLTESKIEDILSGLNGFTAVYSLFGNGEFPDRYELTDESKNKIDINNLNGYQKGLILNDCMSYFMDDKENIDDGIPTGVIRIEEMLM